MEEWKEYSIHEITRRVKVGFVGSCENYYCSINDIGAIPMIRTTDLTNYVIHFDNQKFVTKEFHEKNIKSQLHKHDLLIARHGDNGKTCIYESDNEANCLNVIIIEPDNQKCNYKFLKYLFDSPLTKNILSGTLVGSVQPVLNTKTVENLVIKIPSLPTQQKIAVILSSFDDKIELNNKINNNLEQQAQALFKNWFVDFKPFGGKMPEEWKVGKLGDLVEETLNGDWGKDEPVGTNTEFVYCIRGADIPDVKIGNKGKMPKRYILPKNFEAKHLVDGDIVIEISGGSPTQSTGRIAYISKALLNRYEGKMVCTNFCKAIKPKHEYQMFLYYYWQYLYEKDVFFSYENGTTGIKNLDINGILENEEIAIPSKAALSDFNNFCNSVFSEIFSNGTQSEQLSNVRDTLLPKLMNGEIEVDKVIL